VINLSPAIIRREGEQIAGVALKQADAFIALHTLSLEQQCDLLDVVLTVLATQRDNLTERDRDTRIRDDDDL
jgi:hypothetical protein